jgi:hypothetical protein
MKNISISFKNGTFTLSDNGHTNASQSEIIHWHPGAGVHEVTDVSAKSTSHTTTEEFWDEPPAPNGVNFKGRISGSASGVWIYKISTDVGSVDPRIQVNS